MANKYIPTVALLVVGLGVVLVSGMLGGLSNTAQLIGGLVAAGGVYTGVTTATK